MTKTALYIFLALTMGALFVLGHFTLNESPSEPVGLWRITREPLKRGAVALFKMPLKRIAGLPGDRVDMTPQGILVNGTLQPDSAPELGLPHCPFGTYIIPADMLLALGQHSDSWDSRYNTFCFLPQSLLSSTVEPVWTK